MPPLRILTEEMKIEKEKELGIVRKNPTKINKPLVCIAGTIAAVALVFVCLFVNRPPTLNRIVAERVEAISSDYEECISLEELSKCEVTKAYPIGLEKEPRYSCEFLNKAGERIGTATFLKNKPYFYYENQIYEYKESQNAFVKIGL